MSESDHCGCSGGCSCASAGGAVEAVLPGDPALFRHSALRERMLDRIARVTIDRRRPLTGLGSRAPGDPAIALIDAAAGAAHVLATTLRRLHLDSTLPASSDPKALALLTGLLGHQPRPAISATVDLAVTVQDLADPAAIVTLPKGAKIASVPGKDELPLVFETDAELVAHAVWNTLLPARLPKPQLITAATADVLVEGAAFPARTGDSVLIQLSGPNVTWLLARVLSVEPRPAAIPPQTRLTLGSHKTLGAATPFTSALAGQVLLLGARAQAFGAGAANLAMMSDAFRDAQKLVSTDARPTEWPTLKMDADGATNGWQVHLDAVYGDAAAGRAALFDSGAVTSAPHLTRISSTRETARTDFGLSSKCTVIGIEGLDLAATTSAYNTQVRTTVIHLETARAPLVIGLVDTTVPLPATPDRITVHGQVPMSPGRRLILSGPAAADGVTLTETATLLEAQVGTATTTLIFDEPLLGRWKDSGLVVLGNAVPASQGETPASGTEVLGSGNPSRPVPRYALAQAPVAHVPASGPRGYAPAIEVRVGGRLYRHQDSLWQEPEDSQAFRLGERPDGKAEVQFAGRLPSGQGNLTALYRKGGGLVGNLGPGRLSMVLTPVAGIGQVTNPAAAAGGSDAETLDDIRTAAPAAVRAMDRAVSLSDFEAIAAGYRGVGKALASDLRLGLRRIVCLTIATTTLAPPAATLIDDLKQAVAAAAPPGLSVEITGFRPLSAVVGLTLASDPALSRASVEAAVRDALVAAFGLEARPFGRALHRSEVQSVAQSVPGVVAVMVPNLQARHPGGSLTTADQTGRLDCPGPTMSGAGVVPAGLLSVAAADVLFAEMPA
jgi:Baseplate J-like protein